MCADKTSSENGHRPGMKDSEYITRVIKEFINNEDNSGSNSALAAPRATRKNCYNRQDVLQALSKLQLTYKAEYVAGLKVNINTDEFKRALLNSMAQISNSTIPKSVNQIDGRTIDFVEMIFGAFLRDHNISDAVKSLLLRMQIPVIKTALIDNKFFYDHKHVARHVLDTIAHLGIGIDNKENTVYQTMGLIIDQLLNNFDQNIATFQNTLSSLSRLQKIENEKQAQNEKQTRQQILKEHARQMVLTELQYHVKSKNLPKAVQPLVLKFWSTVMYRRFLKYGDNSNQWHEAVNILKVIVKTTQPPKTMDDWFALKTYHETLVDTVGELLHESGQSKEHIFNATRSLEKTYQTILEESAFSDMEDDDYTSLAEAMSQSSALSSMQNLEQPGDQPTAVEIKKQIASKKIESLPSSVKPGVWFEIFNGENKSVRRLKLSVIIKETAQLVFVDRVGKKVIEKDAIVFAEEIANNKSRVLADHSIFDHALGQVISSLAANA